MSLPFDIYDVSPTNFHPHELCSHCSSPYHSLGDCPHWGQLSNFSNEQLNTSFFSPGCESNSNFYNSDWSNHFDFSWHDHATENFAPQVDELHHLEYSQFDNHVSSHSSYDYPPEKSSLEDTLKEFMELVGQPTIPASHEPSLEDTLETFRKTINQPCHGVIDATVANTEAIARLEGQFGHPVAEFNIMEEKEFQSNEMAHPPQESLEQHFPTAHINDFEERANQLMAARHAHTQLSHTHIPHQLCEYCYHHSHQFDDCPFINHYMTDVNKSALENAQTTTILVNEEIGDEIASECSLEDPEFLEQAVRFIEPELEDPLEESFAQFEFDLDFVVHEQVKALLDPIAEMRTENREEEIEEQIEPPPISNWPNDKEVSTETHSLITIPLETQQIPSFQCLEEPSYVVIFEDSHTKDHKSRNRVPKWIPRNKDNYIRWRNILPEGYQILKKQGWKGLFGHPYERGRRGFATFYFFIFFSILCLYFIFLLLSRFSFLFYFLFFLPLCFIFMSFV
jgi:hypothetical protein